MSAAPSPCSWASETTTALLKPTGRWSGRATQRPMPETEEIEALDPVLRKQLSANWLGQAATEARVGDSFRLIHQSLAALGADRGLVALAARAVDDEHRHAVLAEQMAGAYAKRVVGPHPRLAPQRPRHPAAKSDELRRVLYIVGQCSLNETFASAYLSAARRGARTELSKWALRELLEDEIDHARIGWAFLSEVYGPERRHLNEWLLPLTVCNLREWRNLVLPEDDSLASYGVPPREVAHAAITEALEGVIVPGFRHVGFDTRALERWIRAGAVV